MTDYALINIIEEREYIIFILWDGKNKIARKMPARSYFFVKKDDYDLYGSGYKSAFKNDFPNAVEEQEITARNHDANGTPMVEYVKITLTNNWMRQKIRVWFEERGVKTYEADIKASKRFLIDNPNTELHAMKLNYTFFDIETDDRKPLVKDNNGVIIPQGAVLSFTGVDNEGNEFTLVNESPGEDPEEKEAELLIKIGQYFEKYCVGMGWNSSMFDFPYIKQRMTYHNIAFQWDTIVELDYIELFKKNFRHSLPSYKLNFVADHILGDKKIDHEKGHGKIYQSWLKTRDKLLEYNLQDSRLLYNLNKRLQFTELHFAIADTAHCLLRETLQNSLSGDVMLMIEYKARNIVMPSKPTHEEQRVFEELGSIGGGYTTCLKKGLHKKVEILDFKSMYPSVIETWNISPETIISMERPGCIITPDDWNDDTGGRRYHPKRYYLREKGVVPTIVRRLVDERDKTKYSMKQYQKTDPGLYQKMYLHQYALKVLANSIYGILSFSRCRYYSYDLGDSVTSTCRALTKACYECLEGMGGQAIGGDTDSIFAVYPESLTAEEGDKKLAEHIGEWIKQWNITEHCIVFEHEKTVGPMLFVMKKNYAYLCEAEKTEKNPLGLTLKGLECIKSDANPLAAKLQKDFVIGILTGEINADTAKDWMERLMNEHLRCFGMQLTEAELTMSKELTKMPDQYGGYVIDKKTKQPKVKKDGTLQMRPIPAHVKLANRLIAAGEDLTVGMKIPYVVVGQKPLDVISAKTFEGKYDAEYYWARLVKPSIKVMASSGLNFNYDDLKIPRKLMKKYLTEEEESEEEEE